MSMIKKEMMTKEQVLKIHEEYRKRYPDDEQGYSMLLKDYYLKNDEALVGFSDWLGSETTKSIDTCLRYRWAITNDIMEELLDFLEKAELGDIFGFLDNPEEMKKRQSMIVHTHYHTMRSTPLHLTQLNVELGRTYVLIGFVDLQQILFSNITNPNNEGHVSWFCVENNEISLARSKVILELIKSGACSVRNILQIWYSTSIGSESLQALRLCCKYLSEKEELSRVKMLLRFWSTAELTSEEARKQWAMTEATRDSKRRVIFNMEERIDRQEIARYFVTGEIFLDVSECKHGNVTMFSFPGEFRQLTRADESLFTILDLKTLLYTGSFVSTVEQKFLTEMVKFQSLLKDGKFVISLNLGLISKDRQDLLQQIKLLKPAVIDWSNIPEYWTNLDFFEIAQQCSVKMTQHTFRLMIWSTRVYGCSIFDYLPVSRNNILGYFSDPSGKAAKFYESLEDNYHSTVIKDMEPFLRSLHINTNPPNMINMSAAVLVPRYIDTYIAHFFRNQEHVEKVWELEAHTPFSRTCNVIHVTFTNRVCDRN